MGRVEGIFIATKKRQKVKPLEFANLEAGKGILGDRYHRMSTNMVPEGKSTPSNHITFVAKEELKAFIARHKSNLDYGDFRRNIITSQVNLNALVGKEFLVGSARCRGVELCEPCQVLSKTVSDKVLPELIHRAGLRAIILDDGALKIGDKIEAI